ncbi:uncharacterized protein TRIVIDRAFT_202892 [Trichoderma virens Gv29-8]|uniref:Uncharacterized protein n=1 Tax=Hypocrea virens (strain Gv29-8 / FGSC 10586) TaxID=413071 RepID=G9MYS5_HYPVG|nr:uncharacterized protein TRIVIDRAFT_202892 [Trichoderma virens Gv29-8]EHK20254.1 hypothetical protein TRIVIDRAFT_202892 [Trichoderma virens Gv29-8]
MRESNNRFCSAGAVRLDHESSIEATLYVSSIPPTTLHYNMPTEAARMNFLQERSSGFGWFNQVVSSAVSIKLTMSPPTPESVPSLSTAVAADPVFHILNQQTLIYHGGFMQWYCSYPPATLLTILTMLEETSVYVFSMPDTMTGGYEKPSWVLRTVLAEVNLRYLPPETIPRLRHMYGSGVFRHL